MEGIPLTTHPPTPQKGGGDKGINTTKHSETAENSQSLPQRGISIGVLSHSQKREGGASEKNCWVKPKAKTKMCRAVRTHSSGETHVTKKTFS